MSEQANRFDSESRSDWFTCNKDYEPYWGALDHAPPDSMSVSDVVEIRQAVEDPKISVDMCRQALPEFLKNVDVLRDSDALN